MPSSGKFSEKSKAVTLFSCMLCLHRFYVGKWVSGIFQCILSLFLLIGYIWVAIDVINILRNKFTDSNGNLIVSKKIKTKVLNNNKSNSSSLSIFIDDSQDNLDLMSDHIQSIDFSYDEKIFNSPHFYYTLYLMCIIAYYNDGKVSMNELNKLKILGVLLLSEDCPDKELTISEILLEILDTLKESYSKIEDSEERYQLTLYITYLFSNQIKSSIEKRSSLENNSSAISGEIEAVLHFLAEILVADGKELTKNAETLRTIAFEQLTTST